MVPYRVPEQHLTLTLVVFEFIIKMPPPGERRDLTLTLVVFELFGSPGRLFLSIYLTLTLVVFEFHICILSLPFGLGFNLNIGCI